MLSAGKVFAVATLFARYGEEECLNLDVADYIRHQRLRFSIEKTVSVAYHFTMEQIEQFR